MFKSRQKYCTNTAKWTSL